MKGHFAEIEPNSFAENDGTTQPPVDVAFGLRISEFVTVTWPTYRTISPAPTGTGGSSGRSNTA